MFLSLVTLKMNVVSALVLSTWISVAVSTVEVTDGPVFTSLGSNFQLKCVVSGNDSFKAWRNAAGISVLNRPRFQYTQSGNEHNLNIINVQAKDRGIWTCWSTKRKRDSVILNVVGPRILRILQKSSGNKQQYLREGSPGIIKINVRGYPPIEFEWKKNGEVLGLSERYSVARSGSLMISKVDFDDAGTYSVAGTQLTYETYIEGINVTVLVPSVKIPDGPYVVLPGQSVELKCVVSQGDSFKAWKTPAGNVFPTTARFQYVQSDNEHILKINNAHIEDGGIWTCLSEAGYSDSVTLNIVVAEIPPNSAEKEQYLVTNSQGMIKINIVGYPQPNFEWKKNGEVLELSGRYSTTPNGSLKISNVDIDDEGIYSVIAAQEYLEVDITGIVVTVRGEIDVL